MTVHFAFQSKSADPRNVLAWCGREVPRNAATMRLTEVQCIACRKSFAARLRQMPTEPMTDNEAIAIQERDADKPE